MKRDWRRIFCLLLLLIGGCGLLGTDLNASPQNWTPYEGRTVSVTGTAGNSGQGPIVRFNDGGYIPLRSRIPWGIDAVGKPVVVTGKVVSGQGFRAEKYVIEVETIKVPPPEEKPVVRPAAP